MSNERLGNVLPRTHQAAIANGRTEPLAAPTQGLASDVVEDDAEVVEFVRFCYRRRSVAWPELYDEMCAVAARGDYRGLSYEQLEPLGIGFALSALPRLAALSARVVAEERGPAPTPALGGL